MNAAIQGPGEKRLQQLLKRTAEIGASDIHLKTGLPPVVRLGDDLRILSRKIPPLTLDDLKQICDEVIPSHLSERFKAGGEIDMAYHLPGHGRFRLNVHRYRSQLGIVGRFIPFEIRSLQELAMPPVVKQLALQNRGLILVTGNTGSGKSTTVAAMVNEWNQNRGGHIVTIEDPIEYLLFDKKSIITQREVGLDTESFAIGLRAALRQDPDVIVIGELRDRETILAALNAAETGHLVLGTLHTKDTIESVNRIVGVFDPEAQREVRMQFAASLMAIISQRLVPGQASDLSPRPDLVPAVEILVNTARVRDILSDPKKMGQLRAVIEQGKETYGMQSFDQHLMQLIQEKKVSRETAVKHASNPSDFELRLKGISSRSGGEKWEDLRSEETRSMTRASTRPGLDLDFGDLKKKKDEE